MHLMTLKVTSDTDLPKTTSYDRQFHPNRQVSIPSSTPFTCHPLKCLYIERTCMPHPKILLYIRILQTWEVKPEDLEALTPYSPYKERAYIYGILVNSISLYKHQDPSSLRYVEFLSSNTLSY